MKGRGKGKGGGKARGKGKGKEEDTGNTTRDGWSSYTGTAVGSSAYKPRIEDDPAVQKVIGRSAPGGHQGSYQKKDYNVEGTHLLRSVMGVGAKPPGPPVGSPARRRREESWADQPVATDSEEEEYTVFEDDTRGEAGYNSDESSDSWDSDNDDHAGRAFLDSLRVHKADQEITLDVKRCGLSDKRLRAGLSPALIRKIHDKLGNLHPDSEWCYMNVDISDNDIGPPGTASLVKFLRRLHAQRDGRPAVYLRILRAYRNRLGDLGSRSVAELIVAQPKPMHELHLSHNNITALGAATIVMAFGSSYTRGPKDKEISTYPFPLKSRPSQLGACWLRLERNDVEAPEAVAQALEAHDGVRVVETSWASHEWGPQRSPSWATNRDKTPQAILHIFEIQVKTPNKGGGKGKQRRELATEAVKEAYESVMRLLEAVGGASASTSKSGKDSSASRSKAATSPSPAAPATKAEKKEKGAGKGQKKWVERTPAPATGSSSGGGGADSGALPVGAGASQVLAGRDRGDSEEGGKQKREASSRWQVKKISRREDALLLLAQVPSGDDPEVSGRWRKHVEASRDPDTEAGRISRMIMQLTSQGYFAPAAAQTSGNEDSSATEDRRKEGDSNKEDGSLNASDCPASDGGGAPTGNSNGVSSASPRGALSPDPARSTDSSARADVPETRVEITERAKTDPTSGVSNGNDGVDKTMQGLLQQAKRDQAAAASQEQESSQEGAQTISGTGEAAPAAGGKKMGSNKMSKGWEASGDAPPSDSTVYQ